MARAAPFRAAVCGGGAGAEGAKGEQDAAIPGQGKTKFDATLIFLVGQWLYFTKTFHVLKNHDFIEFPHATLSETLQQVVVMLIFFLNNVGN